MQEKPFWRCNKLRLWWTRKANNDLVTQADFLVDDKLKTQLLRHFPDCGWLSEESADDLERLKYERVWIVDPIDGTKNTVSGIPEYAISIALVKKVYQS